MNELKILITAVNSEAKKAVKEVKDEIDKVKKSAKENGKSISDSMKAIAKGAAIAAGAITAIAGAMAALGKSAQEVNKGIEKLNTAFKGAGSTSKQATDTYKQLFGILGDHDRAIETAQSLARITTEADKLSEYYTILAGSAAKYGEGISPETLSENIAETIAQGKAVGELSRVLVEAGISEDAFNNSLAQTASLEEREIAVRNTLNQALGKTGALYIVANQATIQYNQSQANLNLALAQATRYTTPFLTAVNNLGASLLTLLGPALQTVATYLTAFIQLMISAIQWVGSFFGMFGSSTKKTTADVAGYKKAMDNYLNGLTGGFKTSGAGIDNNISKLKELKKQTMGFDELNVVSSPTPAATGGGGGGGGGGASLGAIPPMPKPEDFGLDGWTDGFEEMSKKIDEAKEKIKALIPLILSFAAAFALFNLPDIGKAIKDFDLMSSKLRFILGDLTAIAGGIMLIIGYSDAWVNGLDWGNFATILAGVALLITGLGLSFGGIIASIAAVGAGIAMLVLGLKDLWTNGASVQNILLIIIGVLTIFAATWFAASLPIAAVVAGIAAVIAIIVICIKHWDDIKEAAGKAWEWIKEKWSVAVEWFQGVWDGIVEVFSGIKEWFSEKFAQAWEGIQTAWSAVGDWFSGIWSKICEIFALVKEWFSEKFSAAWEGIKELWNGAGEWFSGIWSKIGDAFGNVKQWFSTKFSEAWQAVKDVFSGVSSFFSGLWTDIKGTFTALGTKIGDAIGGAVKTAINSVIGWIEKTINKAIGLINGAINIINKLPGVSVGTISKLSLPRLAKGGVVDSATIAMIGEAGKEAVVPLENNTQWMDTLADRIAARSQNPTKVILKVGEKELGWATIGAINGITEQTGELQLAL